MKICVFAMDASHYGEASIEIKTANYMAERGNEVYLFCERMPNLENKSKNLHIHVMPVISHVLNVKELTKQDYDVIKKQKYDVIFGTSISAASLTVHVGKMTNTPVVNQILDIPMWRIKYFDNYRQQWQYWLENFCKSDGVIYISKKVKEDTYRLMGDKAPKKSKIVFHGIDTLTADTIPKQKRENQILFVSHLRWYKGLDMLFYALKLLSNPPLLKIIGSGEDMLRLVELASGLKINCQFLGSAPNVVKFTEMKKSKLYVYPEFVDCLGGLTPLEALYCETPAIAFDFSIKREFYGNTVDFVEPCNIFKLAEKIERMLMDEDYRKKRGKEGKLWVSKNRTFRQQAEEDLNFLREAV